MKIGYTHIGIVLDRSGSMSSCQSDTIGRFNQFLSDQRNVEGEATLTFVQFDDHYDILNNMSPLADVEDIDDRRYVPRGSTALLDAIGRTLNSTEHQLSEMSEDDKPERVIFVIITDGEENSSREFTRDQIMEMINNKREENTWEFIFIGANQDAIQAGGSIGVRAASSMSYDQSQLGTQHMYASLSSGMTSYRSAPVEDLDSLEFFSENDKNKQDNLIDKDKPTKSKSSKKTDANNLYRLNTDNLSI